MYLFHRLIEVKMGRERPWSTGFGARIEYFSWRVAIQSIGWSVAY